LETPVSPRPSLPSHLSSLPMLERPDSCKFFSTAICDLAS
jgi:hypothetical protein